MTWFSNTVLDQLNIDENFGDVNNFVDEEIDLDIRRKESRLFSSDAYKTFE